MESKLLKAAKALYDYLLTSTGNVGDIPNKIWLPFRKAISEAEAAPTPKPDPWACRLHPSGRCGMMHVEGLNVGCSGAEFHSLKILEPDVCPWPKTRQKPAPAKRTKLDVACEVYEKAIDGNDNPDGFMQAMREVLVEIGVNPQDEMEG